VQSTESVIGPYELHDFFLFHFLRYGAPPEKILFLAEHAEFERKYSRDEVARWLRVFIQRLFANQFKRSCLPDGPKVGTIALSPRGDWRMPSDAQAAVWQAWAAQRAGANPP
jgi:NAD+ synthase (glutamine-hydrolysing)